MGPEAEIDQLREKCGVFGIYAPGEPIAELTYEGLQMLQHRGQEGAGISVSYGPGLDIIMTGGLGKVPEVFQRGKNLEGLSVGAVTSTGQNRYGTSGTPRNLARAALQPMHFREGEFGTPQFTLSHNGNIESLNGHKVSDSAALHQRIATEYSRTGDLTDSLHSVLPTLADGAFSLVLSTQDQLIGARDSHGFRPLHLGRLPEGRGWVMASEIAALDIIGAEPEREVLPGEIITITGTDRTDLHSTFFAESDPAVCAFEFVYFSRPDNELEGEVVADVRERMGRLLAKGDNIRADMVIGVPESGIYAADGYSWESGIPHKRNLLRNAHVDRTFIAPTQDERAQGVRNKLNPLGSRIKGNSVVIVDDSIVRATTQKELTRMLRGYGATEIHIRISSPPYKWPCFYGMDTGRPEELIASQMSVEEICEYIGADSLKYLSNEDMQLAVGSAAGKICTACTTGVYPTPMPITIGKRLDQGDRSE